MVCVDAAVQCACADTAVGARMSKRRRIVQDTADEQDELDGNDADEFQEFEDGPEGIDALVDGVADDESNTTDSEPVPLLAVDLTVIADTVYAIAAHKYAIT